MVETDFMRLYEELSSLSENWHRLEHWGEPVRLWFSDSAITFKNFMSNISTAGFKGLRLVVAPGIYLAANAESLNHEEMKEIAAEELGVEIPSNTEQATCGIPKCYDFELGNFEIRDLTRVAEEDPEDEMFAKYLNYDAEKDYAGKLVADYGTFEITLYSFKSRTCPEYKSVDDDCKYYEDTETYKVLKPLLKRIYIYGI